MNTLSKIKYLLCVGYTLRPCDRGKVTNLLLSVASVHGIKLFEDEAILPENDPLCAVAGLTDTPRNRICYDDVILTLDRSDFAWLYMRTGYIHILSKTSHLRMYNHLLIDSMPAPGRFKMSWYKLKAYFIRKTHKKEIDELLKVVSETRQ